MGAPAHNNEHVESLKRERGRLQNAINHLIRSNEEIQKALIADDDAVYSQAIQENQDVLQSMREKLALLEAEITELEQQPGAGSAPMDTSGTDSGWL